MLLFNINQVRPHRLMPSPCSPSASALPLSCSVYPVLYSVHGPQHATQQIPSGHYQSDLLSAFSDFDQLIAPAGATASRIISWATWRRTAVTWVFRSWSSCCIRRHLPKIQGRRDRLPPRPRCLRPVPWGPRSSSATMTPGFPLPGGIFHHLPLYQGAVLARFSVFVFLFAALLFGVSLERLRHWSGWHNRWVGLGVALVVVGVALVPLVPALPYAEATVDTPSFFTTAAVDSVPSGSVAVVYPPTTTFNADAMLWEASAAMRFKMPGVVRVRSDSGYRPGPVGTLRC